MASLYGLIARMYLRVARVIPRAMTTAFAPMKAFAPVTAFAPMTALSLTLGFAQVIASGAGAAPFAAIVADARTGEILYSSNADARLHPASLTKMLTLYITFDAIERGEVSLDTMITVSRNAASQPPSKLGLKAGQRIALRYLIRAAAIKSANDAAVAIGDALSGSQERFAERMNRTAKALGMKSSTFKNANGLTEPGHLSTAADMNLLGRRLFYDFPQYYNLFSRRTADAGIKKVSNTNRRFLDAYEGADGIKTGYTVAAGFNLTASAERGSKRIIATVFGGKSTANRNAKMAELLDVGFKSAPRVASIRRPSAVSIPTGQTQVNSGSGSGRKTIRLVTTLKTSPRPQPRPPAVDPSQVRATAVAVLAMQDGIEGALAAANSPKPTAPAPVAANTQLAATGQPAEKAETDGVGVARARSRPAELTAELTDELTDKPTPELIAGLATADEPGKTSPDLSTIVALSTPPRPRPVYSESAVSGEIQTAMFVPTPRPGPTVVTRMSTAGGRQWGVNLGRFGSKAAAERLLMKTMLTESATLQDGLRKVVSRSNGYDANFMGLTQDQADLACRRLQARAQQCFSIAP